MNKEEITISIQNEGGFRINPDSKLSTGKVIINNIEITSIEDWGKVVDSLTKLQQENEKYKEVIDKAINELFILKDMIYKPETREENFEIQRKISSIIKRLNGKEVE